MTRGRGVGVDHRLILHGSRTLLLHKSGNGGGGKRLREEMFVEKGGDHEDVVEGVGDTLALRWKKITEREYSPPLGFVPLEPDPG